MLELITINRPTRESSQLRIRHLIISCRFHLLRLLVTVAMPAARADPNGTKRRSSNRGPPLSHTPLHTADMTP